MVLKYVLLNMIQKKDKAFFDREGKDSFKFSQTGADVAVVSPNKTTLFKKEISTIDEIIIYFKILIIFS